MWMDCGSWAINNIIHIQQTYVYNIAYIPYYFKIRGQWFDVGTWNKLHLTVQHKQQRQYPVCQTPLYAEIACEKRHTILFDAKILKCRNNGFLYQSRHIVVDLEGAEKKKKERKKENTEKPFNWEPNYIIDYSGKCELVYCSLCWSFFCFIISFAGILYMICGSISAYPIVVANFSQIVFQKMQWYCLVVASKVSSIGKKRWPMTPTSKLIQKKGVWYFLSFSFSME